MSLGFSFDTRFFIDGKKLYFRKGVWNTIDGIIDECKIENTDLFIDKLNKLQCGNLIENNEFEILSENDKKHLNELISMGFIKDYEHSSKDDAIKILTGQNYIIHTEKNEFTLITDSDFIEDTVEQLSQIYNYTFKRISKNETKELSDNNLFSKVNSLEYEKKLTKFKNLFIEGPILVLLNNANLPLLNNLNHIASKNCPLFIGFLDGPFMIYLSIIPKITACWECFEQRMHSFVKDHVLYNKFMNISNNAKNANIYNLQMTNLLHLGLQEVITWNQVKMGKFMGRVLFIYLPTFEIHFHNIERISSCNHCGYISRKESKNSNISLSHIVNDFLKEKGIIHGIQ